MNKIAKIVIPIVLSLGGANAFAESSKPNILVVWANVKEMIYKNVGSQ